MMIRLAALALLTLVSAVAQPSNAPPSDRRVVEVKHLRGLRLDQAIKLLTTFLLPGDATSYPDLNSVVLRGTPESTAAAEMLLKKFDVPTASQPATKMPESYQLRIYMVQAYPEEGKGGPVAEEIASAVAQMRHTFNYKSYRLLDTAVIQAAPGSELSLSGMLPSTGGGADLPWYAGIRTVTPAEEGKVLMLNNFDFRMTVPKAENSNQSNTLRVTSNLSVRLGQKVVVGKLSATQATPAIFLILTAEPTT